MTQEMDERPEWERRYDRIDAMLDRIAEQQDRNTKGLDETRKLIGDLPNIVIGMGGVVAPLISEQSPAR